MIAKLQAMPVSLRLRDIDSKGGPADGIELEGQIADLKTREVAEFGAKNETCASAPRYFVACVRDETLAGPRREYSQETI